MRIVVHHVAGKTFRLSRQVEAAGSNICGLETIGTVEYSDHLIPEFEFKPEPGMSFKAGEEEYVGAIVEGISVAHDANEAKLQRVVENLEKMKNVLVA